MEKEKWWPKRWKWIQQGGESRFKALADVLKLYWIGIVIIGILLFFTSFIASFLSFFILFFISGIALGIHIFAIWILHKDGKFWNINHLGFWILIILLGGPIGFTLYYFNQKKSKFGIIFTSIFFVIAVILVIFVMIYLLFFTDLLFEKDYLLLPDNTRVIGDIDKAEVVDYSVITRGQKDGHFYEIGEGFIHSDNTFSFRINVTVKNKGIDGELTLYVNFYDSNNNYLGYYFEIMELEDIEGTIGQNLYFTSSYTKNCWEEKAQKIFNDIDHIGSFELSVFEE